MTEHERRGGRPTPLRWRRRVAAALVAAAGVLGGPVLAAGTAEAASSTVIHPEWVDGCEGCPGPIMWVQQELDRRTAAAVTAGVEHGLAGLIAAHRAGDQAAAARLRDAAIAEFVGAVRLAGNTAFGAGFSTEPDDYCGNGGKWWWKGPIPPPHWFDVEQGLADGLTLLGQAALTRDADVAAKLRAEAEVKLDGSAAGLETFQGACAG